MSQASAGAAAASRWLLLLIVLASLLLSALVPPLQSPDELDHLKRAYVLSRGHLLLQTPPGGSASGGAVDTGLLAYLDAYWALPFKPQQKVTPALLERTRAMQWSGEKRFDTAPGTGYYLPLAYLPQAVALAVGRHAGLSIDVSYRAARLLSLLTVLALAGLAMRLFPMPPVVIGLLALPMTLFQLSSATLDAVTYALTLLALACYLHAARARAATRPGVLVAFSVAVFIVITCRVHLFPLLLLFAALWRMTGRRAVLWAGLAVGAAGLAWTAWALHSTVDTRVVVGAPPRTVLLYYLTNPAALPAVISDTVAAYWHAYVETFIGRLGWLDAAFDLEQRAWLGGGLLLLAAASIGPFWRWRRPEIGWRLLLLACSAASVLLIFVALLVAWNPHPARFIDGVQGRYFWAPVLMACLALAPSAEASGRLHRGALVVAQVVFIAFSAYSTAELLLARYWVA
ncbi:MAG: DUF2142 domain-containing protein [Proteobacteria bacterium]|nr:DUF2142 domain-containing protein [Pseudomonadota bacterium]